MSVRGGRYDGLSRKGYGIHGTDVPSSIGYAQSHGCIRLRNADVERLFEQARAGDVVELHPERTLRSRRSSHRRTLAPPHRRPAFNEPPATTADHRTRRIIMLFVKYLLITGAIGLLAEHFADLVAEQDGWKPRGFAD